MEAVVYVYLTTNMINGRMYVGKRNCDPVNDPYLGSGTLLQRAIKKYGKKNFIKVVLAVATTVEELNQLEIEAIASRDAINSKEYYNLAAGGSGGNTWASLSFEEKSALAMRIQASLSTEVKETRAAMMRARMAGIPKTEIHKLRISQVKLGVARVWKEVTREEYSVRRRAEVAAGINVPPMGNRGNREFRHTAVAKEAIGSAVHQAHLLAKEQGRDYHSAAGKTRLREAAYAGIASKDALELRSLSEAYQAEMQRRRDAGNERYADLPEMLKTMSQSEAAEILGVDQSAIAQRVRDHNIVVEHDASYHAKIQGKREAAVKLAHVARRAQGDATWEGFDLLKMAETMTQVQIGKIVGVSQVRVSQRLRELRGVTGPKRARSRKTP